MVLALTSDSMPLYSITEYAATALIPKLSQVEGVGEVTMQGGQARAVRLQVNPRQLAALGLSLDDVRKAIHATTVAFRKERSTGRETLFRSATTISFSMPATFLNADRRLSQAARRSSSRTSAKRIDGLENEQACRVVQWQARSDPQRETATRRQHHYG